MSLVERIFELFSLRGSAAYHGESVSQLEHALQAAWLADRQGAPEHLVLAALLHDVGHLLEGQAEDLAEQGIDGGHELAGELFLASGFGPEIVEPIRLHVAAKRYLCAVEPAYGDALSPASRRSLELQGGPMSAGECAEFQANPRHGDAIRLRRWDDQAKIPQLATLDLESYLARLRAACR
jgi:phosphonate degradation associated HDIG domain protein